MKHCENLIDVHHSVGSGGSGRHYKEVSVNRAIVVLAVAAWQALVEDLTRALLDMNAPSGGMTRQTFDLLQGPVRNAIGRFATPNAEKTRELMLSAGFDPRPHWRWTAGIGVGPVSRTPTEVASTINDWLQIRHCIAHGQTMKALPVLEAVRLGRYDPENLSIRLADARNCVAFFKKVGRTTGDALSAHFSVGPSTWP